MCYEYGVIGLIFIGKDIYVLFEFVFSSVLEVLIVNGIEVIV